MGFSRQEYWSGLPFPTLEDLADPGIEPTSPVRQVDFFFFTTKPRLHTISLIRRYFSPWKYPSSNECTGYNNSFQ